MQYLARAAGKGSVGFILAAATSFVAFMGTVQAAPPHPGFKVIDVVIDQAAFEQLCVLLHVNDEQKPSAQTAFESYKSELLKLDNEAQDRVSACTKGEAERLRSERDSVVNGVTDAMKRENIFRQYDILIGQVIDQAAFEIDAARAQACLKADALLATFFGELKANLGINDDLLLHGTRLVRRLNLLAAKQGRQYDDLARPIDLFNVLDDAARVGNELESIATANSVEFLAWPEVESEHLEPKIRALRDELRVILGEYEAALDAALAAELGEDRRSPKRDEPQSISSDDPEFERLMKAKGSRWFRRFDPVWSGADRILRLIEKYDGIEMANRWQDRITALLCPNICAPRWPSLLRPWLLNLPDLSKDQAAAMNLILVDNEDRGRLLEMEAIEIGIRVKHARYVVDFQQDSDEDLLFAKKKLAIHHLNINGYRNLRGLLTTEHCAALDERIFGKGGLHYDPLQFGPRIDWAALEALGERGFYDGAWIQKTTSKQKE